MDMINQDLKKNHVFFAFLFLLLWFDMVSKAKKQKKLQLFLCFLRYWLIACMQKKAKNPRFLFFVFIVMV